MRNDGESGDLESMRNHYKARIQELERDVNSHRRHKTGESSSPGRAYATNATSPKLLNEVSDALYGARERNNVSALYGARERLQLEQQLLEAAEDRKKSSNEILWLEHQLQRTEESRDAAEKECASLRAQLEAQQSYVENSRQGAEEEVAALRQTMQRLQQDYAEATLTETLALDQRNHGMWGVEEGRVPMFLLMMMMMIMDHGDG